MSANPFPFQFQGEQGRVITGPDGAQYPANPAQLAGPDAVAALLPLLGNPGVVDTGFDNKFTSGPIPAVVNPATGNAHNAGLVAGMIARHGPVIAYKRLVDEGWTPEQFAGTPLEQGAQAGGLDTAGFGQQSAARGARNDQRKAAEKQSIRAQNPRPVQAGPGSAADQSGGVPQNPDTPNGGVAPTNAPAPGTGSTAGPPPPNGGFNFVPPASAPTPGPGGPVGPIGPDVVSGAIPGAYPQQPFQTPFGGTPFSMAQSPADTAAPFQTGVAQAPAQPWSPGGFPTTPHPLAGQGPNGGPGQLDINAMLSGLTGLGGAGASSGLINQLLGMFGG